MLPDKLHRGDLQLKSRVSAVHPDDCESISRSLFTLGAPDDYRVLPAQRFQCPSTLP
jgi:hypothetical protein